MRRSSFTTGRRRDVAAPAVDHRRGHRGAARHPQGRGDTPGLRGRADCVEGPLLADWLEAQGRVSEDVDLLVAPAAHDSAETCLMAARYRRLLPDHPGPIHASTWCRGREAIIVDLHRSLPGATSVPERQWIALAAHTERAALDGGEVEVLDLDGRLSSWPSMLLTESEYLSRSRISVLASPTHGHRLVEGSISRPGTRS